MTDEFPEIETKNYRLREIVPGDKAFVFQGLSHPEVIRYYGVSFTEFEEIELQMEFFRDLRTNSTGIWWAVESKSAGIFLGACGFNNWRASEKIAELGFWILRDFWSKGIMTEVLPTVCSFGFSAMELLEIEAIVESENKSCKRLLDRNGFKQELVLENAEEKNGKMITLEIFKATNP